MPEPTSLVRAFIDAIERLFGKVGFATLLGTAAFLFLPARWFGAVGLDPTDQAQRRVAGILFLLSAAACLVTLALSAKPIFARFLARITAARQFRELPLESRVLLGIVAHFRARQFFAPAQNHAVQALIDRGLLEAQSEETDLRLLLSLEGGRFVRRHRAALRECAANNHEIATQLDSEISYANRRGEQRNRYGWMAR